MNSYTQGSTGRFGEPVDDQFVHDLLAVLGDCRLLWLPNLTDTTTSTDKSRHAATITWSENLASFDGGRTRLGAGVAVAFNGTDEEGDAPDADRFSFGDGSNDSPFSVIALIKPDVNNVRMDLVAKMSSLAAEEWTLLLDASGQLAIACVDESAGAFIQGTVASAIGTDWALVGGTYNGSRAAAGFSTFTDGVKRTVTPSQSGTYTAMENTAGILSIAARYSTKQDFFNGSIALVAVAARELTPDEMWAGKEIVNGYFGLDL